MYFCYCTSNLRRTTKARKRLPAFMSIIWKHSMILSSPFQGISITKSFSINGISRKTRVIHYGLHHVCIFTLSCYHKHSIRKHSIPNIGTSFIIGRTIWKSVFHAKGFVNSISVITLPIYFISSRWGSTVMYPNSSCHIYFWSRDVIPNFL